MTVAEGPRGGPLYKILTRRQWARAGAEQRLPTAPIDEQDGFVHLSAAHQVRETAEKWFAGQEDLVLVAVDPARIPGERLIWEPSRGGDDFPHVYGDVPLAALGTYARLPWDGDGFAWPAFVPTPLPGEAPPPPTLVRRFESVESCASEAYAGAVTGGSALRRGAAVAAYLGPGSPLNALKGLGFEDDPRATVEAAEAFFERRGAPSTVELASHAPADLLAWLSGRGYLAVEFEAILARRLGHVEMPRKIREGPFELRPTGPEDAHAWGRLLSTCFVGEEREALVAFGVAATRAPQSTAWFILREGEPVGCTAMRLDHEVASLGATAVLPEHRRAGAHAFALHARLCMAADWGNSWAKLEVAPGSESHRNVARAGFDAAYTRVQLRRN